jgi:hypothetical protein
VFSLPGDHAVRRPLGIALAETRVMQTSTLSPSQIEQQRDERQPKRGDSKDPKPSQRPEPAHKVDEPSLPYLPIG